MPYLPLPLPAAPRRTMGHPAERLALVQRILALRDRGLSARAIAAELGTTVGRVQHALRRAAGAPPLPNWRVRQSVREHRALGHSPEHLASSHGLTLAQVVAILDGERAARAFATRLQLRPADGRAARPWRKERTFGK